AGAANAETPAVKDNARPPFFKSETVEKANKVLREIHDQYGKDLVIEAFSSVPEEDREKVKSREDRDRYFKQWLQKLAREQQVNGVVVLICRSPGHVEVGAGRQTEKRDFLPSNERELGKIFLEHLAKNNYKPDEGLMRGVEYVRDTLRAHHQGSTTASKTTSGTATPGVRDNAKPPFFKTETVQNADKIIREIHDKYGKDLIIETVSTIPESDRERVGKMSSKDRERYFEEWVQRLAREQHVNGIYLLICRHPGHVEVGVGHETEKRDFLPSNKEQLKDI